MRAHVTTRHATATIYLQGAHLTAWQPASQEPVIFLSRKSDFLPGKPIRGGIPIAFPWFATDSKPDRIDGHPGPSHGFARLSEWTLSSAVRSGDDAVLTFELGPNDLSRSLGFEHFHLKMVFTIGPTLTLAMTVTNTGDKPLQFEEAFHSYYAVTDIHEVTVTGLEPTSFIDKTDNMKRNPAANAPLTFTKFTDRVYNNTTATCTIHDGDSKAPHRHPQRKLQHHGRIEPMEGVTRPWAVGVARNGRRRNREHGRERRHACPRRKSHHACDYLRREELERAHAGFA